GDVDVAQCVVVGNAGSGLYVRGNANITDCEFERNGVGVNVFGVGSGFGDRSIERCEFRENGVGLTDGNGASVRRCSFVGNDLAALGGGSRYATGPRFEQCEFFGNRRGLAGYTSADDSAFTANTPDFSVYEGRYTRCAFIDNVGRATLFQGDVTLNGCLIAENTTTDTDPGEGFVMGGNQLTIVNSTIVRNSGPPEAPLISVWGSSDIFGGPLPGLLKIRNSILDSER